MRFIVTALDKDGNVVFSHKTKEVWSLSEIQVYFDRAKSGLYTGRIKHFILEAV